MYNYMITRTFGESDDYDSSLSVSDRDPINCAHLLASGFNTLSRNVMNDFVLAVVDTKAGTVQYDGKVEKIDRADKRRDLLESAYAELERVKNVLFDAGVEMIPADAGVRDLMTRLEHERHARAVYERENGQGREAARAELIKHVKGAYEKWSRIDPDCERDDLKSHLRGMLEVLSRFLVVIGEAEDDERHAVAKRLCGIPEGTYLYDIG